MRRGGKKEEEPVEERGKHRKIITKKTIKCIFKINIKTASV